MAGKGQCPTGDGSGSDPTQTSGPPPGAAMRGRGLEWGGGDRETPGQAGEGSPGAAPRPGTEKMRRGRWTRESRSPLPGALRGSHTLQEAGPHPRADATALRGRTAPFLLMNDTDDLCNRAGRWHGADSEPSERENKTFFHF